MYVRYGFKIKCVGLMKGAEGPTRDVSVESSGTHDDHVVSIKSAGHRS